MLTVSLSKMVNQGRLDLTNTETMVTINDDDGESKEYNLYDSFPYNVFLQMLLSP